MKGPNIHLIGIPESDGKVGNKLENMLPAFIQENFPSLASKTGQHSNSGNIENLTKILLKKSNPKTFNHQIHQG